MFENGQNNRSSCIGHTFPWLMPGKQQHEYPEKTGELLAILSGRSVLSVSYAGKRANLIERGDKCCVVMREEISENRPTVFSDPQKKELR